jgi:WD40 repeat protein
MFEKPTWIRRLPKMRSTWNPELRKLEGHTSSVWAVAFSHDSQLLASASGDETVRLWNPATGDELRTLEGHTDAVWAVAFSHDSQLLASASDDETVRLWNPATGDELRKSDIDVLVQRLSFSKSGPYLETDRGLLRIQGTYASILPSESKPVCNVFVKRCWVARDMENLLWLPPNYQPVSSALQGNILVLGHESGQITFWEFSFVSS